MEGNKETKLTEEEMKKEIELMQQYINSHSLSLEFYDYHRKDDKNTLTNAYVNNKKNDFVKVYYANYSHSKPTAMNINLAIFNIKKQIQEIPTKNDTKIINIKIIGDVTNLDDVSGMTYCDTLLNKDILGIIIDKFGTNCIFVVNNLTCYGSNTVKIWYDMMQLLKKCNYNKSFIFGSCHKNLGEQNTINEYLYIDNNTMQNSTPPEQCNFTQYGYYEKFIDKNKSIPLHNIKKVQIEGRERYINEGDIIKNQHQYYKQICDAVDKNIYTDIIKQKSKLEAVQMLYNTIDDVADRLFTNTIVEEKEVMEGGCCGKITTKRIEKKKYDNESALSWQNQFFRNNIDKLMKKDTSFQDILNLNMQLKNLKSSSVADLPAL